MNMHEIVKEYVPQVLYTFKLLWVTIATIVSTVAFLSVPGIVLFLYGYENYAGLWVIVATVLLIFFASVEHVMRDFPNDVPFWQKLRHSFLSGLNLTLFGILFLSLVGIFIIGGE